MTTSEWRKQYSANVPRPTSHISELVTNGNSCLAITRADPHRPRASVGWDSGGQVRPLFSCELDVQDRYLECVYRTSVANEGLQVSHERPPSPISSPSPDPSAA